MNKIAILQSNYIPWKGVFDMINMADIFVFFDDVDFTKRDWRSRNKIKTANGDLWLTVPVKKPSKGTKIYDIEIYNDGWQEKHFKTIKMAYKKSRYFNDYLPLLEDIYLNRTWKNLSQLNQFVTKLISELLGIKTQFINSKELETKGTKDDKLIEICKHLNAKSYISGPAAKDYIDIDKFKNENIDLEYIIYDYPNYSQQHGTFNHFVSVLDVLFNCGKESNKYIFQSKKEIVFSSSIKS
jgi:hypothetical protein